MTMSKPKPAWLAFLDPVTDISACQWIRAFFGLCLCILLLGCAGAQPSGQQRPEDPSPREVQIRLDLAEAYLRNNEPRMSLRELLLIERVAARAPRYQFTLGYTQFMLGNWPAAVEALERTVALDPNHAEGWNNLGLAHLAMNDFTAAEFAFQRALEIPTYQTPEIAAMNLALLHMERNDPFAARRYAERAYELNWRFGRAYLLAAEIEVGQGNLELALDILQRGVEADLTNTRLMLTLAEYLLLAGRDREAMIWLERIFETADQGSPEAQVAEGYLLSMSEYAEISPEKIGLPADQGAKEAASLSLSTSRMSSEAIVSPPPSRSAAPVPVLESPEAPIPPPLENGSAEPSALPSALPPDKPMETPLPLEDGSAEPSAFPLEPPPDKPMETPPTMLPATPPVTPTEPLPEVAPQSPSETAPDAYFIVQVGGFLERKNASDLYNVYAAMGYPAGITEVTHMGRRWFLVYIDKFSDKDAAQRKAREFERQENAEAVVTHVGRGRYLPLETPEQ